MKVTVLGGGSTYTPELIKGFIDISSVVMLDEVVLYDIPESSEKLNKVFTLAKKMMEKYGVSIRLKKNFEISDALKDAEYVIFQFRPGFLEGRYRDESIPLKFNLIGQETTGMGGFAAALRAFPIIEKYVDAVARHSNATVINFTNPSGHITEFVLNYLKFERFIGLCNVPINIIRSIADLVGCKMEDIFLKYYGLNHLSFVEKVYVKDEDYTQKILGRIDFSPANISLEDFPRWLIDSIGLFPNPYLKYYLFRESALNKMKKNKTRAEEVMEIEKQLLDIYEDAQDIPDELSKRGGSLYSTAAAHLIRDLKSGYGKVHIVNVRNEGAISNLPDDYVLEIPCYIKGGKPMPISLGEGDEFALAYTHTLKMYERLTIEAYMKKSKKRAVKAILAHPLGPGAEKARELLDTILEENREWITLNDDF